MYVAPEIITISDEELAAQLVGEDASLCLGAFITKA